MLNRRKSSYQLYSDDQKKLVVSSKTNKPNIEPQNRTKQVNNLMVRGAKIYCDERYVEGNIGTDSGASIIDGVKILHKYGVCFEVTWPYHIQNFAQQPYDNRVYWSSSKFASNCGMFVGRLSYHIWLCSL